MAKHPREFDVSGDCIWLGSYQVARLNPDMWGSLRSQVIEAIEHGPMVSIQTKYGNAEIIDIDDFMAVFDQIKKKLKATAEAGLIRTSDMERIVDEMKDGFLLE